MGFGSNCKREKSSFCNIQEHFKGLKVENNISRRKRKEINIKERVINFTALKLRISFNRHLSESEEISNREEGDT